MGIIARQTIKGSIYSYLGAFIGFINVGLIMPQIFSTAEIGLTNLLVAVSAIFGQFGSLGFINVTLRQFPYFRDEKNNHNGFLFFLLAVGTLGFLLCSGAYYILKPSLIAENVDKSPLFAEYVYLLIPLIFITIFHLLIDTYNRVLFNASFGLFVKEFLLRILNLFGILLFYFGVFDFHDFIIFYTISYGIPVMLICLLLMYKHQFKLKPSFSILKPSFLREIISVAAFGSISGFSGMVIMQLDRYLINHYCDLSATGIYSTVFFFGSVILLPGRSLIRISGSLIAEAFKNNDNKKVDLIYRKSTTSLTIIGLMLFILIWGNVNNILQLLPEEFSQGKYVILCIALAHVLQMVASVSGEIIQFSKYYRQHVVIMIVLIISIICLNIIMLPIWGIIGAGIASAISFFIYFILRFIYIKIKFGFQPFDWKHLIIILMSASSYFISLLLPQVGNFVVDIIIRSGLLCVLFGIPLYFTGYSEEYNLLVLRVLKMFKIKKQ
ncbi:MAG TPA: polysaccharide biosynthesis C-terminal domain-containing protein [Bacteroidales bacterium]|nr:polysaccharide biosynthesis C-terminal domain-containing protein [Bacteroidales bacterium]